LDQPAEVILYSVVSSSRYPIFAVNSSHARESIWNAKR
jgi:hypothetical protein